MKKIVDALADLLDKNPPKLREFLSSSFVKKLSKVPEYLPILRAFKAMDVDLEDFLHLMTAPTTKVLDEWFESEPLKATLATDSVIGAMMSPDTPGSG